MNSKRIPKSKTISGSKKFILGTDVIQSAGKDTIKAFQDDDSSVMHTIFFNRNKLDKKEKDDIYIKEFMQEAQRGTFQQGGYIRDGVKIILNKYPEFDEKTFAITSNPHLHEDFRENGINHENIEKPGFLCRSPDILKTGLIPVEINEDPTKLENKLLINFFDLENPFLNQFIQVKQSIEKGGNYWNQAIYQIKQDFTLQSEDRYKHTGEPYLELVCSGSKIPNLKKTLFGVETNGLTQYLALEKLLLNEHIKLIFLTGRAGSGKTLIPYIAGLAQTLYKDKKTPNMYNKLLLTKANDMLGGREIGFLKGDEQEKIGPIIESYAGCHEIMQCPFSWEDLTQGPLTLTEKTNLNHVEMRNEWGMTKKPIVSPKHTGFLRGYSLKKTFYIVDEGQNFGCREMQDFIDRTDKGSKIIICGDPVGQIDHPSNTPEKNGIVWSAHEHLKNKNPYIGIMNFTISERSPITLYNNRTRAPRD